MRNYAQTPFPVANVAYPGMVITQSVSPSGSVTALVIGTDHYGAFGSEQDYIWALIANTDVANFQGDRMVDYANIQSTTTYYDNSNTSIISGDVWYVTPCSATGLDGANSDNYNATAMSFSEGHQRISNYNHHGALIYVGSSNTAAFVYNETITYNIDEFTTGTAEVRGIFGSDSANLFSEWGAGYTQLPVGWYLSVVCIDGNNPYDIVKGSWFTYQSGEQAFVKDILICPTIRPDGGS